MALLQSAKLDGLQRGSDRSTEPISIRHTLEYARLPPGSLQLQLKLTSDLKSSKRMWLEQSSIPSDTDTGIFMEVPPDWEVNGSILENTTEW
ncbi:hypothetical protein VE03_10540, partial [Pseudogymnoascus sp. 23342-1-I1]